MQVDSLFVGASFLTLDDARPRATALAVAGDRIFAVGEEGDLRDALRPRRVIDLGGATVVPGFNDAHNHMAAYGLSLRELPLHADAVATVEDIYARVAEQAATQKPGTLIVGSGYDQNKLAGGRHPDRWGLDRAAPDHLVWLKHTSGHMCVVNSRVLTAIDLEHAEVPEGGVVVRDANGEPNGLLQEQAQALVRVLVHPYAIGDLADAIADAARAYLTQGITSCQEAGIGGGWIGNSPRELAAYQQARDDGRLGVRVSVMVASDVLHAVDHHDDDPGGLALDLGLRTGLGDEWLRLGPVKVFADGSLIGRTAAMVDDFADDPGNHGYFQSDPDHLRRVIVGAHRAGWQVATHAIGDRAVAFALDCYEEALRGLPRADHRHRIEHCGVCSPASLDRIAALGVIPVPQGRFVNEIGDGMRKALGPERSAWCYRQRSFLDRGIPVPGSSDRPVVNGAPLLGLHDLVNQRTSSGGEFSPEERLTPIEALRCFTVGSAHAQFEERRKGRLVEGMLADFAVLSADPTQVDADAIAGIDVVATVVGGEVAYDGAGRAGVGSVP